LVPRGVTLLTAVTVNVNGIRAADRRGGLTWLAKADADILCLQEIRATHEQLHEVISASPLAGWHVAHAPAPQLGRSGVAVLTREQPSSIRTRSRQPAIDGLGRWVEVDLDTRLGPVTVVSTYVHTGEAGTPRQQDKYAFLEGMEARMEQLRRSASRRKANVLVCGDLNIAHQAVDLKNWRGNRGKAGFLEQERAHLDRWLEGHWVDLGRALGGPGPGPYTWWSWRGKGFDTDGGWRIDYAIASAGLAERCTDAVVGKAGSYAERWSDHAPLTVRFA
jgi:exodeoxyribonuclease III